MLTDRSADQGPSRTIDEIVADLPLVKQLIDEAAAAKKQLRQHLDLAARIHESLLPSPIQHPRIDVDVRYVPLDTVGGDYCQVRFPERDPSRCYITMCDVRGRGISAALLASRISGEVRHFIEDRMRPVEIVRALNGFLYENFRETGLTPSFFAAQINLESRIISYSGAGHPSPLLLRHPDGLVHRLISQNEFLNVHEDCLDDEPEHTHAVAEGDRLLFFTDGLLRTANAAGRRFSQAHLVHCATDLLTENLFQMTDHILERVERFRHGTAQDDMTLIVAEIK